MRRRFWWPRTTRPGIDQLHLPVGNPDLGHLVAGVTGYVRTALRPAGIPPADDTYSRLNSRLQDLRPAWTFYSGILLGGNKHIETFERSDGFEGRL
jgi:hypothetical protein